MKFAFIFLNIVFVSVASRADLIMQEQVISGNETNRHVTKIHGNKICEDTIGGENGDMSHIQDANTGDIITLWHQKKQFKKTSGARIRELLEKHKKQSGDTNATNAVPKKLVNTGKSEKVGGYDANIFRWPVVDGSSMTYWVAKDFPNYGRIKADLAKMDQFRALGLGKGLQPDVGTLPGMVVKLQIVLNGELIGQTNALTLTTTLISAKEEPVDASIFEIPKDYKEPTPPNISNQPPSASAPNQ